MITVIQNTKNIPSFGAGLTKNVVSGLSNIKTEKVADEFKSVYKIDADFGQNPVIAACTALCADIFECLSKQFKLPFNATPKRLRVYNPDDLIKPTNTLGFCIPDTKLVLKSEPPFELRSIFFAQHELSLKELDNIAEQKYSEGLISSNHFLHEFIHEWSHNIHLDSLYKKFGYEGACPYGKKMYFKNNQNNSGLDIISKMQEQIPNPFEIVAETYSKLICNSLDEKTLLPKKNPFEDLKKQPENLLKISKQAGKFD